jgi:predicted N-formylglutamate amidohydrolase
VSDASDYTIIVHGEQRGIPHVEPRIRQDLLASESDVQSWAERLEAFWRAVRTVSIVIVSRPAFRQARNC